MCGLDGRIKGTCKGVFKDKIEEIIENKHKRVELGVLSYHFPTTLTN